MNEVIEHIVGSIGPASVAQATAATQRLMRSNLTSTDGAEGHGGLAEVAARLSAARHSPAPDLTRKTVVVVAADHGVASLGIDLGPSNPTTVAMQDMSSGKAAINSAARSADTNLVLVDAGITGGDRVDLGQGVLSFRIGDGTHDFCQQPAMSLADANAAIQTGIALAFSLADAGLDILALGQLAAGSQPASVAVVAALSAQCSDDELRALSPVDYDVVSRALLRHQKPLASASPIEVLALVGGYDMGVLTGLILAAASINVPVVLDGHATSAAALLACRIHSSVREYLFASQRGEIAAHAAALSAMRLEPLFAVGLAQGEGTGAVLAIPMLCAAVRVLEASAPL